MNLFPDKFMLQKDAPFHVRFRVNGSNALTVHAINIAGFADRLSYQNFPGLGLCLGFRKIALDLFQVNVLDNLPALFGNRAQVVFDGHPRRCLHHAQNRIGGVVEFLLDAAFNGTSDQGVEYRASQQQGDEKYGQIGRQQLFVDRKITKYRAQRFSHVRSAFDKSGHLRTA